MKIQHYTCITVINVYEYNPMHTILPYHVVEGLSYDCHLSFTCLLGFFIIGLWSIQLYRSDILSCQLLDGNI